MRWMTISQVAKQFGLRTSTLRYYEQIGLLPLADRVSGQRRYGNATLARLAVVQRARQSGFTLDEIRHLFSGFDSEVTASARWRELSRSKLVELDAAIERIQSMKDLLHRMDRCGCDALHECGENLLKKSCREAPRSAGDRPDRCDGALRTDAGCCVPGGSDEAGS